MGQEFSLVCPPVLEPHTQGSYMGAGDPNLSKSFCLSSRHVAGSAISQLNIVFFLITENSSLISHADSSGNRAGLAEAYLWKSALCSRKENFKNQISSVLLLRSKSYLLSISDSHLPSFIWFSVPHFSPLFYKKASLLNSSTYP